MAVELFFCYAHEDEAELTKLKTYLSPFQRQGLIDAWHDRDINAGAEWVPEIWQGTPFGKLQALPRDGKAVIGSYWNYVDEAFFNVAEGVRKAAVEWTNKFRQKQNVPEEILNANTSLDKTAPAEKLASSSLGTLSGPQKLFLASFLSQAGDQAVGEKISFVRYRGLRYLRWKKMKIAVSISDEDLLELARLGYLQIYTDPRSIIFTKLILEAAHVT